LLVRAGLSVRAHIEGPRRPARSVFLTYLPPSPSLRGGRRPTRQSSYRSSFPCRPGSPRSLRALAMTNKKSWLTPTQV